MAVTGSQDTEMPAGAYAVKSSVEDTEIKKGSIASNFQCDGCMFRHTKFTWQGAPADCRPAHEVRASAQEPAVAVTCRHLIEDLLPFDCDVYWKTVWVKCEACHACDIKFMEWVAAAQRDGHTAGPSSPGPGGAS